ncbi:MAG TPA: YigZ family protein [Mobilitalea sp.]|nr:YigZ family protein [Mobilitalea sp.]
MEHIAEAYKTIYEGGIGEVIMKKSRFIATVSPIETEDAALAFIAALKKKYWDASHNCYAYIIGTNNPLMRYSDDGEPSMTAGKPMLDVLGSHELFNLVVVVTRYFGGTLLGTGGLVKAYQSATIEGLENSKIIKKELGLRMQLTTDYNLIGKLQYYVSQESFPLLSSDYSDIVTLDILVPPSRVAEFMERIAELTNGSALLYEKEQVYFTIIDNEVHLF